MGLIKYVAITNLQLDGGIVAMVLWIFFEAHGHVWPIVMHF